MKNRDPNKQLIALLRASVNTLVDHPIILYPLCITVFIQLLTLEILYFSPRYPLSIFFAPIIKRIWSEVYLHYPLNYVLLPKLFYYVQVLIFVFIGGFLNAIAISMVTSINSDKKTTLRSAVRENFPLYIHILIASLASFYFFTFLSRAYKILVDRFMLIKSEAAQKGVFLLKKAVVYGDPYINLLLGVLATVVFVYVVPVIVIEKKKVISAFILNIKNLLNSFWFMIGVILFPTLLYVPVLLLRSNVSTIAENTAPGAYLIVLIISVFVTLAIDAVVFTATTTFYLLKKESA